MLPATLRKLLEQTINSLEKLEIVVALAGRRSPLTQPQLETELPFPRGELHLALQELLGAGVVEVHAGAYQLVAERAAEVAELVAKYDTDRVLVLGELSTIAMDRIRGMAARTFADAFVLRKKRGDRDG
jgi:hypothetical protein